MNKNMIDDLFLNYPSLKECKNDIYEAYDRLYECAKTSGTILVAGNGGSASDAEHIVAELMKSFILPRKIDNVNDNDTYTDLLDKLENPIKAISLVSQEALLTAIANDIGEEYIFAQQVYAYGSNKDILIVLSTSGNSKNIINALAAARIKGMLTIGFTGSNAGRMEQLCDIIIKVPEKQTYRIQELHMPIYHALCKKLEYDMFEVCE